MAYVDGLLVKDEKVLRREEQHWILPFYIAGKWVALAFVVFIVSFLLNWWLIPSGGGGFFGTIAGFISNVFTLITVVALLIAVVGFVWSALRWRSQEYVLTDQRVIHVRGVITKQSSDSVLESLSDAKIQIPFLGRMMGWGNMILMTANESGNERMLALRDPIGFKKAVLEAKTARTMRMTTAAYSASNVAAGVTAAAAAPIAPTVAPSAAPSGEDVTKTLTALAGLRDSGAITPEEYEAKKKELLDRI
jgi:uncharacterized membrane protein